MQANPWNAYPAESFDYKSGPAERLAKLAIAGFPQLAADTLLNIETKGKLVAIVGESISKLEKYTSEGIENTRESSAITLFEIALNLFGMEKKRVGFSETETSETLAKISTTLRVWENTGGGSAVNSVVHKMLDEMKLVLSGKGMVAKMATEIEAGLVHTDVAVSFLESSKKTIQQNVYYRIVDERLSKFGNDSATGLRWARHLGAVQVSSNPVIAARAYDEISDLWKKFETISSIHPEWSRDPEKYADEIALYGTVVSLLPNILDFRPIALLSDFKDGMVSIQLNPRKALDIEESVKDARKFYSILTEILQDYDVYLGSAIRPGEEKTRPNIVFKVSTIGDEAVSLTERLDKMGIGTNNTVTFTVAQEITVTLVAMKGLATALKSGIPITTIYITNMEGRLEDHLRETQAAAILRKSLENDAGKDGKIGLIARKIGAIEEVKKAGGSLEDLTGLLCSKKYLKSLQDPWFVEVVGMDQSSALNQMEDDIRMSGIFVTRRVYQLLFRPTSKQTIVNFCMKEFGLSESQAVEVVGAIDLLPASKRHPEDTYLVLGEPALSNLTNTEFPDHQLKVLQKSREPEFNLSDYEDSISEEPDPETLKRLLGIPDFRRAYELTPGLVSQLTKVGIQVSAREKGDLEPTEWKSYGPVRKTMEEFNNAYTSFRTRLVDSISKRAIVQKEITAQSK